MGRKPTYEELELRVKALEAQSVNGQQAEKALTESEEKFRSLAETSPAAIAIFIENRFVFVNTAWEKMSGYNEREALMMDPYLLIHPDMREDIFQRGISRLKGEDVPSRYEAKCLTKNQKAKWIDMAVTLIQFDGKSGMLIVANDITERKKMEKKLRESEERYRSVVENSFEAIRVFNETRHLYANQACLDLLGYEWDELKRLDGWEIVAPERREWTRQRGLRRLKGEAIPARVELPMIRKDGKKLIAEVVVSLVHMYGRPAISSCMRDITERKRAEEVVQRTKNELESIIDSVPALISYKDTSNQYLRINKAYCDLVKLSREDIEGKTAYDIVGDRELAEKYFKDDRDVIESGTPKRNIVEPMALDPKRTVRTDKFPYIDDEGNVTGVIAFATDITSQLDAEEEKQKLEAQLQHAHKMEAIGTLVGGIAHDFNNILGIIIGNTELALDDVPDWNTAYYNLEAVKKAGLRAKDVIRQLLSFSRKTEREQHPLELAPLIKESFNFLRSSIPTSY